MSYMQQIRERTLAGAIDRFVEQSQRLQRNESGEDAQWDSAALAPGQALRDFLPKSPSPPPPLSSHGVAVEADRRIAPSSLRDYPDPTSKPGVCGLMNMGNTCYMNAGLQCVRAIPEIVLHYLSLPPSPFPPPASPEAIQGHLTSRLSTLIHKMWSGSFSALHPKAFKATLGALHTQFSNYRQQDCQEFLAILLDMLHEEASPSHCHLSIPCLPLTVTQSATSSASRQSDTAGDVGSTDDSKGMCEGGDAGNGEERVDAEEVVGIEKDKNWPVPEEQEADLNRSVVADTFKGSMMNEVVCHTCHHLSTKEEPFVYLSVPLPNALERQICVVWVPVCLQSGQRRTVRVLVTVLKHATVQELKRTLSDIVQSRASDDLIVLAEVKDNTITRVLPEALVLRNVEDTNNDVYAFELASLSNHEPDTQELLLPSHPHVSAAATGCKHWKEEDTSTGVLPAKMFKVDELSSGRDETATATSNPYGAGSSSGHAVVVEWHSCSICLEELVDAELLTHSQCGAVLCTTCHSSAVQHYADNSGLLPCPICSVQLKSKDGFTPLAQPTPHGVIKLLQTTILFRRISAAGSVLCLASPSLLNLPSAGTGNELYTAISPLLPPPLTSFHSVKLCLTDAKGQSCSRCLFNSNCHGCILPNSSTLFELRPGDHIAVTLGEREEGEEETLWPVLESHPSLQEKRNKQLSLEDCLIAFSQREVLSEGNHWFCPACGDFQPATRRLTVSRLPQTTIIHLKRFMYHSHSGSKVEVAVTFPMELVAPDSGLTQPLALTAAVCHFGSLNCGHYTAYVKHCQTGEWGYYNDETVIQKNPSDKDAESVYILFYRRKDLPAVELPAACTSFDDETELNAVTRLLRQHKPLHSAVPNPAALKRSNSTGALVSAIPGSIAAGSDSITTQTHQLLASLGLDTSSAIACALPLAPFIPSSPPPAPQSSTPIVDNFMNLNDLSDHNSGNVQLLSVRSKEW